MNKKRIVAYAIALSTLGLSGCDKDTTKDMVDNYINSLPEAESIEQNYEPQDEHLKETIEIIDNMEETLTTKTDEISDKLDDINKSLDEIIALVEDNMLDNTYAYLKNGVSYTLDTGEIVEVEEYQKVKVLYMLTNDKSIVEFQNGDLSIIDTNILEIIPSKYVEVDISDQTLWVYDNGEIIFTTLVDTGKPSTPTPIGYNLINAKQRKVTLSGPTWNSYVEYWVPFIGHKIGLHDAKWQEQFGGDWYLTHGSHGCVNVSPSEMPKLYDSVEVGTPVLIHK